VLTALGLIEGSEAVTGGRIVKCVWHADSGRPNLSVTRRDDGDGTISVRCFSCQATGDVLHLIAAARGIASTWHSGAKIRAAEWKKVLAAAAQIAGIGWKDAPRKPAAPPAPKKVKVFPEGQSVRELWNICVPLLQDDQLSAQLRARGLDPAELTPIARALPRLGAFPRWAVVKQQDRYFNWSSAGYRLCLPMWAARGTLATLHARRFGVPDDERKGTNPSGHTFIGSVLSNGNGLHVLQKSKPIGKIVVCEGAPDFLTLSTQFAEQEQVAVFGIISGSWTQEIADRIPDGAHVTIWTHTDAQRDKRGQPIPGAGQLYAIKVARSLGTRCDVRIVHQERPTTGKAPDVNAILMSGGRPAVAAMLQSADRWQDPLRPWREQDQAQIEPPPEPDPAPVPELLDVWERAAGLVGQAVVVELEHQALDAGEAEERDLLRVVDGVPSSRCFSRRGQLVGFAPWDKEQHRPKGLLADPLGQHFLRTGEAPPRGVVVTTGLLNFLALSLQWEGDDAAAPAVLAGGPLPPIPEGVRVIAWPASAVPPEMVDVDVVSAGLPSVALRVGGRKAVAAALEHASPLPQIERDPEPSERKPPPPGLWPRTDYGNAERMVWHFGVDLKFVGDWDAWFIWDRRRWQRDRTGATMRHAKATARLIPEEIAVANEEQGKWIRKWSVESEGQGRLRAMVNLASSEPGIPSVPERLDADPYLLNVRNGTLDLRTGTLLPHKREHLITKLAKVSFDPKAQCPAWLKFLRRIMDNNERMIAFIKRALGYSLTGDVGAHVFFVLHGAGRNGKSTLLLTIQEMLGDYARQAAPDLLMDNGKGDNGSPGRAAALASLQGARLVVASETERGGRLAEGAVKSMTSGDVISAKYMGQNWFEYHPTHHIFLATNHRPQIKGRDLGIWEKIRLIPFLVTIPREERDRTLPARLLAELPGILNWCLEGCLEWQSAGLGEPPEVEAAAAGYQEEMDLLKHWLEDCCLVGPGHTAKIGALRKVYELWCSENSTESVGPKVFGQMLEEKGFTGHSDGTSRFRKGLMVKGDWINRILNSGGSGGGGGERSDRYQGNEDR